MARNRRGVAADLERQERRSASPKRGQRAASRHARAAEAYMCLGEKATVLAAIDEYEKAMKLAPDNRAYREAHGRACIIYESDYAVM